jgi:hypothetical protein
MVCSLTGDSTKNSKGGSSQGEPSGKIPTLKAWEGSRLKMVGLDALPTYKSGGLVSSPCGSYRALLTATP